MADLVSGTSVSPVVLSEAESLRVLQDEVYEFRAFLGLALKYNNPQVWAKINQFMVDFSSNFPDAPEPEIFFSLARKEYAKFLERSGG